MTITSTTITVDEWTERFKPRNNHLNSDSGWIDEDGNAILFETYGKEHEYVCSVNLQNRVWTWVDGDDGTYITNGYSFVNRIGYFVTEVPYPDNEWFEIEVDKYDDEN